VDIGLGRRAVEDMSRLLLSRDNAETSPPAPAEGLYFVTAVYSPAAFAPSIEEPHEALQPG
jgi:tRNA U38,U39,U40 pseudouridine synthase TruA